MKYYKKLNRFGRLVWVGKMEACTDPDAVEISEGEYLKLTDTRLDPDIE